MSTASPYDVCVIGAGAAGLFCAARIAESGKRVCVLERNTRAGKKILISGGGRCNFTNQDATHDNYVSRNPHFCKSALARFSPYDFIDYVERYNIAYHEKHRGQLFCDQSSKQIVAMLLQECALHAVDIHYDHNVTSIEANTVFTIRTETKTYTAPQLVIATGGLAFPRLGSTDFGYRIAQQFGHDIVTTQPALTPVLWNSRDHDTWADLAGIASPARVQVGDYTDCDDLLFTHHGLSGPVVLRASLHWDNQCPWIVNFFPHTDIAQQLTTLHQQRSALLPRAICAQTLPQRLASALTTALDYEKPLTHFTEVELQELIHGLTHVTWHLGGRAGYDKAEVTSGGVCTKSLSSKTMESMKQPGLFFIGETVDVTGELGGYNFQWAWASAHAAAQEIIAR